MNIPGGKIHISMQLAGIKIKKEQYHILSINDISRQMEEQEIQSWRKLIRVINHEIMNSMTPIATLTVAIRKKLMKGNLVKPPCDQNIEGLKDAVQSVQIIEERSLGLISFIKKYNELTQIPSLEFENIILETLFVNVNNLFSNELKKLKIKFSFDKKSKTILRVDPKLLEQVLINLVKNSMEALKGKTDPQIKLKSEVLENSHCKIIVSDNGEGISEEKLEQVFVPFYSTREEGTGIGLSLCRQIINLHGGKIEINSVPGKGTEISILL